MAGVPGTAESAQILQGQALAVAAVVNVQLTGSIAFPAVSLVPLRLTV